MYDNLTLHFHLPKPVHEFEAALGRSLAFEGSNGEPDSKGRIRVEHRGLRIEYWPSSQWGRVLGSIHTFAQGSNVGVFTAPEVTRACMDIASSLNLPAEVLTIHRLEAGVNLVVPTSPQPFLETLSHHKKSRFWPLPPPSRCLRPLEYYAPHTDYKLKFYNKGAYATRQGTLLPLGCRNMLRYEVVFSRARPLNKLTGRTHLTLADLSAPDVMVAIAGYLYERWQETVRKVQQDYTGLPIAHAALLRAGSNLDWWEQVQPHTAPSTYKSNRSLYLRLEKDAIHRAGPHPYDLLLPKHLQALLPDGLKTEFGTLLPSCNQVEIVGMENKSNKRAGVVLNKERKRALVATRPRLPSREVMKGLTI